jgi:hypothetical protein
MSSNGLIIKIINNNKHYQVYFLSLIRRVSASFCSFNKIISLSRGNLVALKAASLVPFLLLPAKLVMNSNSTFHPSVITSPYKNRGA